MRYTLIRERDGLIKKSINITWVQWNDSGSYKSKHDNIDVGRSLLMSPFTLFYTWLTTPVIEIEVDTPVYKKFKTTNSTYELFLNKEDEWDEYSDLPSVSSYDSQKD